jgi:hypothetical protein
MNSLCECCHIIIPRADYNARMRGNLLVQSDEVFTIEAQNRASFLDRRSENFRFLDATISLTCLLHGEHIVAEAA